MSSTPTTPARRPGLVSLGVGLLLLSVFVVKTVLWYYAVMTGAAPTSSMTGWQWVRVAFYHVAVVAGTAGLIGMLRERAKASDAAPETSPSADGG